MVPRAAVARTDFPPYLDVLDPENPPVKVSLKAAFLPGSIGILAKALPVSVSIFSTKL